MNIKCPFCFNENAQLFYKGKCRLCLGMDKTPITCDDMNRIPNDYELPITLTSFQKVISKELLECNEDVFVYAVCGAGKTEICLEKVIQAINEGKKVGWCIPRREIVLELKHRLQKYFPFLKIVAVCQGFTEDIYGDLIICTTHQLFRYYQYFDLLIVDEPDAFPFVNNRYLQRILPLTVKGQKIYLSATKDESVLTNNIKTISLYMRPSFKLLPVPEFIQSIGWFILFLFNLKKLKDEKNLIFVPTRKYAKLLGLYFNVPYITSESKDRDIILESFKNNDKGLLVTTSVLERGVTIEDINVMVLWCDHKVWSKSALIQIAGRVQRGMNPKHKKVWFYAMEYTEEIKGCITDIKEMNHYAQFALNQ